MSQLVGFGKYGAVFDSGVDKDSNLATVTKYYTVGMFETEFTRCNVAALEEYKVMDFLYMHDMHVPRPFGCGDYYKPKSCDMYQDNNGGIFPAIRMEKLSGTLVCDLPGVEQDNIPEHILMQMMWQIFEMKELGVRFNDLTMLSNWMWNEEEEKVYRFDFDGWRLPEGVQ